MTTIRAFIAIDLPPVVKAALGDVTATLGRGLPRGAVRWVRPEQMHLTRPLFTLRLAEAGCFPNTRRPRVVWVGLGGDEAALGSLVAALEAALRPLGWPPEDRPFRAHLTLGRVKDVHAALGIDWSAVVPPLELPVIAIHLIESQLRPDGAVYTVRHTSTLLAR